MQACRVCAMFPGGLVMLGYVPSLHGELQGWAGGVGWCVVVSLDHASSSYLRRKYAQGTRTPYLQATVSFLLDS